jgi:hypothetical protein
MNLRRRVTIITALVLALSGAAVAVAATSASATGGTIVVEN